MVWCAGRRVPSAILPRCSVRKGKRSISPLVSRYRLRNSESMPVLRRNSVISCDRKPTNSAKSGEEKSPEDIRGTIRHRGHSQLPLSKVTKNMSVSTQQIQQAKSRFGIVGNAPALTEAVTRALRVAPIDLSVLVTGESGSGKEFFPQIIHAFSPRKHSKYIAVNRSYSRRDDRFRVVRS